jgi:hypothetical protein
MIKKPAKFWALLLIAAIISAVVSFFTTALGLLHYLSFILALPLALAVQMGLFGLAWLIGFGHKRMRPLMIALYLVTMVFSVTFSYVFLQSELVEKVKPAEAQRQLFDDIRDKMTSFGNILNEGVNEGEFLSTKLQMWLQAEEEKGWATKTCEEETHCYLQDVCSRVRGKIELWEEKFGRPYREGPGRELIHGSLNEEHQAAVQVYNRLQDFRDNTWTQSDILSEGLSNRDRLTRFDQLIAGIPKKDLEAVLCQEVILPVSPQYEDFARDSTLREEKQLYAFNDLMDILGGGRSIKRSDYPTIFALGLAIFIDLFVLIVAIGAALVDYRREDSFLPDTEKITSEWDVRHKQDISDWVEGALLGETRDEAQKMAFVREVLKTIIFNREGNNVLIPLNDEQYRFGVILVKSKAASASQAKIEGEEKTVFELEDWVYLALTRYVRSAEES